MKGYCLAVLFFVACLFIPAIAPATTQKLHLTRANGTLLTAYYDAPPHAESFPIIVFILGSQCDSVAEWHQMLKARAHAYEVGFITLEKHGVYSIDEIDLEEYDLHNSREYRIHDHLHFVKQLREGLIQGWNGQLIMCGGSEGGMIAAAMTARCPEVVATMILSSGGGMSTQEEIMLALRNHLRSQCESDAELEHYAHQLELKMVEMIQDPTPYRHFLGFTYKWWACHLQYCTIDDILQIDCPLYYAHGDEDEIIPVESADIAVQILRESGKTNFVYRRIEGCNHQAHLTHMHVFDEAFEWLHNVLLSLALSRSNY